MTTIKDLRKKYPQYNDLSDEQLANGMYNKYYSDLPKEKFYQAIGFIPENKETTGWKGIGQDALESVKEAPGALLSGIKSLYPEIKGAGNQVTTPGRLAKNVLTGLVNFGQGIGNIPGRGAQYLSKKQLISPEFASHIPVDETDFSQVFGLGETQPGDALIQGLSSPAGVLAEIGTLSKLGRLGARAGAGGLQALTQNQNPITGAITQPIMGAAIDKAVSLPRSVVNVPEKTKTGVSNLILKKARKDIQSGGSLTPEEALRNSLTNYTNVEGKGMGANFGTLIGNKVLENIYDVSSRIPFSGGRNQLTKIDKQLFDKKDALAKIEHEKQTGEFTTKQKRYEDDLRDSIKQLEESRKVKEQIPKIDQQISEHESNIKNLDEEINKSQERLNALAHLKIDHPDLYKQESVKAYKNVSNEAENLYKPVNSHVIDSTLIDKDLDFPLYNEALNRYKKEASSLKDLFGSESDLGSNVKNELESATHLFEKDEKPTLGALLEHTKSLGRIAQAAKESGQRHAASILFDMRRALKNDAKGILEKTGHKYVAKQLEEADKFYIDKVLPFYGNPTIRKSATEPTFIPERGTFASAIHGENARQVLSSLSPEARKAAIFDLISGKSTTSSGKTTLTPQEIGTRYRRNVDEKVKRALKEVDPNLESYFENLTGSQEQLKNKNTALSSLQQQKQQLESSIEKQTSSELKTQEKRQQNIDALKEKQENVNKLFQEELKKRYGIPKPVTKSIFHAIKNFSPLNAAGLGTAVFGLMHLNPVKMAEAVGVTIPIARKLNKIFTELDKEGVHVLLKHYMSGEKVKGNIKKRKPLELLLTKEITQAFNRASYGKTNNNKEK